MAVSRQECQLTCDREHAFASFQVAEAAEALQHGGLALRAEPPPRGRPSRTPRAPEVKEALSASVRWFVPAGWRGVREGLRP